MSQHAFSTLELQAALLDNLSSLKYLEMTPIQAQSLPAILAGQDVIAQGKTGSGKTAAFGLGLLNRIKARQFCVQSLVLCPTRELADQVAKEIRRLARGLPNIKVLTLCGGTSIGPQIGSLEHGAHIVVGTPGRIQDHLRKGTLNLDKVDTLVLDEADRMLEMGFQEAMEAIIAKTPAQRQTLLFSATYPDEIQGIARRIMKQPLMVKAPSSHSNESIEQHFYAVQNREHRMLALRLLLLHFRPESSLVFCNTKREVQSVADALADSGFSARALHGDMEQRDRDQTLVQFANQSIAILVATDVAARGLDIGTVDAVINYEIAHDAEVHTHRIGRTGRAGRTGAAYSLFSSGEQHRLARLDTELDPITDSRSLPDNSLLAQSPTPASHITLQIDGGKKQKLRPGDILGGLTGEGGIAGTQVGKIHIADHCAYVAIERAACKEALAKLGQGKLKGRSFRVRQLRG